MTFSARHDPPLAQRRPRRLAPAILAIIVLAFLSGCSSLQTYVERTAATGLEPGELVVVAPGTLEAAGDEFESALVFCVQKQLRALGKLRVLPARELRASVFRDLERSELPTCDDIPARASADGKTNSWLVSLGVRYLVCTSGRTESTTPDLAGGGGDGFAIVLLGWDRRSAAEARVYDLTTCSLAGHLVVGVEDTAVVGIIPPFFIPAMTERRACEELGKKVALFLVSNEAPPLEGQRTPEAPISGKPGEQGTADEEEDADETSPDDPE